MSVHYTALPRSSPVSPTTGLVQATAANATVPPALREAARKRGGAGGRCFVLSILILSLTLYSVHFTILLVPLISSKDGTYSAYAVFMSFHVWFFLYLTALAQVCCCCCLLHRFQASKTDPGTVPSHWGFYVGEESKRRRYCRVCNVWKPDRTHHCSSCARW